MRMKRNWRRLRQSKAMRVFTDGSCTSNGRKDAKAGFAAWFPDHPDWSESHRIPDDQPQTNQRAELSAIHLAVSILDLKGEHGELVIYTDSDYSIKCLTEWLPGWMSRGWKTSMGKPVLHRDLIESIAEKLGKFSKHRFHHVRAHTGGEDDLSKQNDAVDRMAREVVEGKSIELPVKTDELFPTCPLMTLGPSVPQTRVVTWIREHLNELQEDIVNKHLLKAFAEILRERNVTITKSTVQKQPMLKAELTTLVVEKV